MTIIRPLLYVAGPYQAGDQVINTRAAIWWGEALEKLGCDVVIPHLSMLWHLVSPAEPATWYARDNAILVRCDAVFRFGGESPGADAEVKLAQSRGIPVLHTPSEVTRWLADWSR